MSRLARFVLLLLPLPFLLLSLYPGASLAPGGSNFSSIAEVSSTGNCPTPPTPEPFYVGPVISPTDLFTQVVSVQLGRGRTITVTSEAGTVVLTGTFSASTPALVTISLLPSATHHLTVSGLVEYATGCFYTLNTTTDVNGNPLIIVQQSPAQFAHLPVILRDYDGFPFTLQSGSPVYISNFANSAGCNWMGIAGMVFDLSGRPIVGLVVHLEGGGLNLDTITGSKPDYGTGGYEFAISDHPIETTNTYHLQLRTSAGQSLSDTYVIPTFGTCDKNLALVNFVQLYGTIALPFPYTLVSGAPTYLPNYANSAGCNWMGIAGQAFDLGGHPVVGLLVHLEGGGINFDTITGSKPDYGTGGYEFVLSDHPIQTTNTYRLQLRTNAGQSLSDTYVIPTFADCAKNLVGVSFMQNH